MRPASGPACRRFAGVHKKGRDIALRDGSVTLMRFSVKSVIVRAQSRTGPGPSTVLTMPVEPPAEPRRQLSAILFADVHGYSGLMSRNEVRTYERVNQAVRLIKSLIGDYGGRVQHVAGDGVLALFESAARALHFAVAIQREFRNDVVWHAEDAPIAFRIGINVGHVLVDDDANVQGHSVNVAARIQGLARPGGICITEAVQRAVLDIPGLEFRRLGPQALKNIRDPVEVFAIEVNGPQAPGSIELPSRPGGIIDPFTEVSVAVLPLANQSDDPRDSHLCDGFTADLITNLSRFRDLRVIARHSAFLFKDRELEVLAGRRPAGGPLPGHGRSATIRKQASRAGPAHRGGDRSRDLVGPLRRRPGRPVRLPG